MKHIAFKDEKNNYFVLKKAKKEVNAPQQDTAAAMGISSSDEDNRPFNEEENGKK